MANSNKHGWTKEACLDNSGKSMEVLRSKCRSYMISLNINKGFDIKKGTEDKAGHRWWYELSKVPPMKDIEEFGPGEEVYIGAASSLKGAVELAEIESQ